MRVLCIANPKNVETSPDSTTRGVSLHYASFVVRFVLKRPPIRLLFAFSTPCRTRLQECRSSFEHAKRWSNAKPVEHKRPASRGEFPSFRRRCLVAFAEQDRSTGLRKFSSALCRRFGKARRFVDMPAPERNHVQVVRCKGCKRCVPICVEASTNSLTVRCPVCMERRSYIVSTEVFMGLPSWEVGRALQRRR